MDGLSWTIMDYHAVFLWKWRFLQKHGGTPIAGWIGIDSLENPIVRNGWELRGYPKILGNHHINPYKIYEWMDYHGWSWIRQWIRLLLVDLGLKVTNWWMVARSPATATVGTPKKHWNYSGNCNANLCRIPQPFTVAWSINWAFLFLSGCVLKPKCVIKQHV